MDIGSASSLSLKVQITSYLLLHAKSIRTTGKRTSKSCPSAGTIFKITIIVVPKYVKIISAIATTFLFFVLKRSLNSFLGSTYSRYV